MKLHPTQVQRDVVEQQLNRITTSKEFSRSERSKRLLRYLVENTVGESGHLLKEYVVGVEVLGKNPEFDTRCNSVVRVEATRLRKKLRAYYQADGAQDPVLISLPRGGYQVRLEVRWNLIPAHNSGSNVDPVEERAKSLAIRPPRYFDIPHNEVQLLLDAIWRSLHLVGGLDVYPPPAVPSERTVRSGSRVKEPATFELDLVVRPSGEGRKRTVSATIRNLEGETICYVTHTSDADLTRCGCSIAHEVLEYLQLSPAAGLWYALGRHLVYQLTPTALWNSRVCFEQSVLANGSDPRGPAALALASALLYIFDAGSPEALVERIRESAPQGTGPDCGVDSYLALAVIAWGYDNDWNEAERLLNIARRISRGAPVVRYWRALFLASAGRVDEAAEELVQEHDGGAFSVASELAFGCAFWLRGEHSKAASWIRWVLAAEPKNGIAHLLLGWILLAGSRPQQAIEPLEIAHTLSGPGSPATAALGFAAARAGQPEQARVILEDLLRGADGRYQVDLAAGIVHLGLGEEDEARLRFRTARSKNSGRLGMLHFTPELGALRSAWFTVLLTGPLTGVFVA